MYISSITLSVCHLILLYSRCSLDSVWLMPFCPLTRPEQEISVYGWLTKVWIEQQPWLTEFFDPAPAELLYSTLRAAVPLIHFNNPLFTADLNQDWLQHNTQFSLICGLQIHKLQVNCVSRQTLRAKTLPELYHFLGSFFICNILFQGEVPPCLNRF